MINDNKIYESGIRNLKQKLNGKNKAEIWFHIDLDGVTSAIAMKQYLKTKYNIDVVDAHIMQYGGTEFATVKPQKDNLAILVDFAHGKTIFDIHTDHHDKQSGAKEDTSKYFKHASANAETISDEISPIAIFDSTDLDLIKTVDSADFLPNKISPFDLTRTNLDDIVNNSKYSTKEKRYMMGFVVNRLLLAYKNKKISVGDYDQKNFLECLVLDANPSLYSMYNTIIKYVNNAIDNKGNKLAPTDVLFDNNANYLNQQADNITDENWIDNPEIDAKGGSIYYDEENGIICQYGGGYMVNPGSYERYTPFRLFPDAKILIIIWPMGLIQASYNPFNKDLEKNIHMGELATKVMNNYKDTLSKLWISLYDIKRISEDKKLMTNKSLGFNTNDLLANYSDDIYLTLKTGKMVHIQANDSIKKYMNIPAEKMNMTTKNYLRNSKVNIWSIISSQSGGHPGITNLSGFNYLTGIDKYHETMTDLCGKDSYTGFMRLVAKDIHQEMVKELKEN